MGTLEITKSIMKSMTLSIKHFIIAGCALAILLGAFLFGVALAHGEVTFGMQTEINSYQTFTFFTATTTTATSTNTAAGSGGYFVIAGAKKVTMYFTHGGTATTSTTGARFAIQTSRDGTNWDNFSKLIGADLSSTATSTYTIQGATSTVPVALDLSDDTFYAVRCISNEIASPLATDGEQTCQAAATY